MLIHESELIKFNKVCDTPLTIIDNTFIDLTGLGWRIERTNNTNQGLISILRDGKELKFEYNEHLYLDIETLADANFRVYLIEISPLGIYGLRTHRLNVYVADNKMFFTKQNERRTG